MALFIAKAPQYKSRQSVPKNIGVPVADLRASRAENEAINRLGTLLGIRADEMKKERDAAVVGDLYNQWRDADREQLSQLLQKKGKDAVNLDRDYDQFFTKSQSKADEQAENGSQQAMVNDMLSRRRENSLDILARYEVAEGQRYKAAQGKAMFDNAVTSGREAVDNEPKMNAAIAEVLAWFDSAHPGASPEEKENNKRMVVSAVKYANMQERINQNPLAAVETLEAWKSDLGEGYYQLKDKLKGKIIEQQTEVGIADLEQKFGGDYDKMIEFMGRKRNYGKYGDLAVSKSIRNELRARNSDKINRENRDKLEGINKEYGDWVKARYEDGNASLGKKLLDDSEWLAKHNPERLAQMYRANSQSVNHVNDDAAEAELLETINTNPTKFPYEEYKDFIWSDKFSGVDGNKRQAVQTRLESLIGKNKSGPKWTEKQKVYFDGLKMLKSSFAKASEYTEKMTSLQNFHTTNPDATDQESQTFFNELTADARRRTFGEMLEDLYNLAKSGAVSNRSNWLGTKQTTQDTNTKTVTPELARDFLKRAGGDKAKARKLAKQEGYEF